MKKQEIFEHCKTYRFVESRIPALDALAAFVPHGQEKNSTIEAATVLKGCARWVPVDGGHKVLIPYEGQEYEQTRFAVEKKAWDHEHCEACGINIKSMTLCWVTEPENPFIILCNSCHDEMKAGEE
jgi:hypothetical protein